MKTKKILTIAVASVISLGFMGTLPSVAQEMVPAVMDMNVYNTEESEESDESLFTFDYRETDDSVKYARVTGLSDLGSDATDIVIPSEVSDPDGGGKIPVTQIISDAFCRNENLISVVIPEGVTCIGHSAFDLCSSLTVVTIPKSVTSIESYAFYNCPNLDVICYSGTEEEWESLIDGRNWAIFNFGVPAVLCTGVPGSSDTTDASDSQEQNIYDDTPVAAIPAKWDDPDLGDIDGDGSVTPIDAHRALVAYASEQVGQDTGLTEDQMALADVDDDGCVTPLDAHYILVYYATQQVRENVSWTSVILS